MSEYTTVASLAELTHGVPKTVEVAGRSVVLVRWGDEVHAMRNICPHQSTPLGLGSVRPKVVCGGRVGEMRHDPEQPLIVCPWHAWTFDLHTGECTVDRKLRVKVYPTRLDGDQVLIAVRS